MRKQVQIPGLEPNSEYIIQIRGVGHDAAGPWSTQFLFGTVVDTVAPGPVTGLSIDVEGPDFIIKWTAPTINEDGSDLDDLRDFVVKIDAGAESVTLASPTESLAFTYSINKSSFTAPQPSIDVEVRARDRVGNVSTPVSSSASNPAPTSPVLIATAKRNAVELVWDDTFSDDGKHFEVRKNGAPYAEVAPGTLTWTDTDVGSGAQTYVIRAVDLFGQFADSNEAIESEVSLDITADAIAPKPPTNATYSDEAIAGTSSVLATLGWTAPTEDVDDTSYTDQEGFDVRYRTDPSRAYQWASVPDDRPDGSVADTFEIEITVPQGEILEWSVRAFDRSGNRSAWLHSNDNTSEDLTPPSKPSTPTVAGNVHKIQVVHDLQDDVAASLGLNVEHLDIYVGETSTFGTMVLEERAEVNGLIVSGGTLVRSISYPVPDNGKDRFVRVVAVSRAGVESVPSDAAPVTVDLVENIHIEDATITDAKIFSLSAEKLIADSAFINDLFVESTLTVSNTGIIQSENYNNTARTGWAVDNGNLYLFDGEIDAGLITLQQGANLLDSAYAGFLNEPEWYDDNVSIQAGTPTVSTSSLWSRYGASALRIQNVSANPSAEVRLAVDATDYNVRVENSIDHIVSAYVYNNTAASKDINFVWRFDTDAGSTTGIAHSIPANSYVRISEIVSSGATDDSMWLGFAMADDIDFFIDGVQIERRVGANEDPSYFKFNGITTIGGGQITTGTLDASLVNVINLNADNIVAGTIDATVIDVINLNASNITSGTIDASVIAVTNLNASNITSGTIDASVISVTNLNASSITAGTMTSSSMINGSPAWSLDLAGAMTVRSAIFGDALTVDDRGLLRSQNYNGTLDAGGMLNLNGTIGWAIDAAGQAEFNNVVVRGGVYAGTGSISGDLRSSVFTSGVEGWRIQGNGVAEFNDINARGVFETHALKITPDDLLGNPGISGMLFRSQFWPYNSDGGMGILGVEHNTSQNNNANVILLGPKNAALSDPTYRPSIMWADFRQDGGDTELRLRANEITILTNSGVRYVVGSTASLPAFSVNSGSGIYSDSSTGLGLGLGLSAGGNQALTLAGNRVLAQNGSAAAPSYSFRNNNQNGMYAGFGTLSFAVQGGERFRVTNNHCQSVDGHAGAPAYSFMSNTNSGMYRTASNVWISVNGTNRLQVAATGVASGGVPFLSGTFGSATLPGFTFSSDNDTGVYRAGVNQVALSAGGNMGVLVGASGFLSANMYNQTTSSAANLQINSGHQVRRSTSSARYKRNIKALGRKVGVLDLTPSEFDAMDGDVELDEEGRIKYGENGKPVRKLVPTGERRLGLIAEDVAELFPEAAILDEEGRPDAIDWNAITSALVMEVRRLRDEVDTLARGPRN